MANTELKVKITVDSNGAIQKMEAFKSRTRKTFQGIKSDADSAAKSILSKLGGAFGTLSKHAFSLKGLLVGAGIGYGVKQLAGNFINVNNSVERLRTGLNTITKGAGMEYFTALNEWAIKMPIDTQKAISTFTMLRALGFKPVMNDAQSATDAMTVLLDTVSAVGGGDDALEGIARALGQISTKGRVMQQELNQLAERGVPAMQILQEKLGLTAEQMGSIGDQKISSDVAIAAIMEGLQERFAGLSEQFMNTWGGLVERMKGMWFDFTKDVGDAGLFEAVKGRLKEITESFEKLRADGDLKKWATETSDYLINLFGMADSQGKITAESIKAWVGELSVGFAEFTQNIKILADAMISLGKMSMAAAKDFEPFVTQLKDAYAVAKPLIDFMGKLLSKIGELSGKTAGQFFGGITTALDKNMPWSVRARGLFDAATAAPQTLVKEIYSQVKNKNIPFSGLNNSSFMTGIPISGPHKKTDMEIVNEMVSSWRESINILKIEAEKQAIPVKIKPTVDRSFWDDLKNYINFSRGTSNRLALNDHLSSSPYIVGGVIEREPLQRPSPYSAEDMAAYKNSMNAPSYAVGTGPSGLPSDGLYYGHQGEIVLNRGQSSRMRRSDLFQLMQQSYVAPKSAAELLFDLQQAQMSGIGGEAAYLIDRQIKEIMQKLRDQKYRSSGINRVAEWMGKTFGSGSFATGTGPSGLPADGLYYGHKGEIVKSRSDSDRERRNGGGVTINISPTMMTGDRRTAQMVAQEIQKELALYNRRSA